MSVNGNFPKIFNPPRQTKGKKFPKILIIISFIAVILVCIIYVLFYSPIFQIKTLVVKAQENLDFLENLKGKNIFLVGSSKIKQDIIQKYPQVAEVKIIRGLPDTLEIQTISNTPKIIWKVDVRKYQVDESGRVVGEVNDEGNLPLVQDNKGLAIEQGEQIVTANFVSFISDLDAQFPIATGLEVVRYEVDETIFQVDVITSEKWHAKFDTTRSLSDQIEALKKFLAVAKGEAQVYVDLRVEGKVYYQ